MEKSAVIHAMMNTNLKSYLKSVGLLRLLNSGRLDCKLCNKKLNINTIGAIHFENNNPILTCNEPACYHSITLNIQSINNIKG